jgi:hypothetical protein
LRCTARHVPGPALDQPHHRLEFEGINNQIWPTAADLLRATLLIAFVAAVLGIVGIEAFWRYFPACGSTRPTRKRRRFSAF